MFSGSPVTKRHPGIVSSSHELDVNGLDYDAKKERHQ